MVRKQFGTDGIRGAANTWPMTADNALRIGMAAGSLLTRGEHRHRVVIGKDTRLSGYMIESALVAGFTSVGMDVFLFGPLPTPAVAMLVHSLRADLGVMISASHNPFHDNGIKLFGPDGYKLSDEQEERIERLLREKPETLLVDSERLGRAKRIEDAQARYIEFAKRTFPRKRRLEGMRIVVDCANGAAYRVAPAALWELGAEVIPIGVEPNGFNINEKRGSTAPDEMCEKVRELRADIGVALDGDADRVVISDERGQLVDGDQLMATIATNWKSRGRLDQQGVVTTIMSNLGMERFLADQGIGVVRTKVGDRHVVEEMRRGGYNVGGEQSGHIVLSDFCTTGDGLIAALQVLAVVESSDKPVSEVCSLFEPLPQVLENVRFGKGKPLDERNVQEAIREGERRLGEKGRLIVRPSGTEPLIRVMGEGDDAGLVGAVVDDVVNALRDVAARDSAPSAES